MLHFRVCLSIFYESFSGFMIARPVCPSCIALNTAIPVFPFIFGFLVLFSFHSKAHNTMSLAFSLYRPICAHRLAWNIKGFSFRSELARALPGFWIIHGTARHVVKTLQEKEEWPQFIIIIQYLNTEMWRMTIYCTYTSIFNFIFMPHFLCLCEQKHDKNKSGKTKINNKKKSWSVKCLPSHCRLKVTSWRTCGKIPVVLDHSFWIKYITISAQITLVWVSDLWPTEVTETLNLL